MKELVEQCQDLKLEIRNLNFKIKELEERKLTVGSRAISDMPRSSNRTDLSNILIKIEDAKEKLIEKEKELLQLEKQLEKIIAPLTSIQRVVIRYRASGVTWNNIAKLTGYSLRQSRRIYDEAIEKIII